MRPSHTAHGLLVAALVHRGLPEGGPGGPATWGSSGQRGHRVELLLVPLFPFGG
ncbi:hypothetical protein [Streptomyces sp. NPDC057438]|uniref:hypothetical protein n=1 Tax=Streptomyces sp. NPDC057438 TaxID=3346133 RepID=UPI0036C4B7AB